MNTLGLFLALSVAGHVDADDLDNRMSVAVRPASVLRVELVVDSTGACDLVVMYIRPTTFSSGLAALESGNATQERQLVRTVGEVVPELLHVLVTGLANRVLPSLPQALGHQDSETWFGGWLPARAGDRDVWVVCPHWWAAHPADSSSIPSGDWTSMSSRSTSALTRANASGSRSRSLVSRHA